MVDSAPVCLIVTVDGVVEFLTPFAGRFTGLRPGDLLAGLYQDEALPPILAQEMTGRGGLSRRPVVVRRPDGRAWAMLLDAGPIEYDGRPGVLNCFTDVNDLALEAEDLKRAKDAAEDSNRSKSKFLANMSHEIRTPMNAILGLLHLTMQTEVNDTQLDYLQKAEGAAKTLLRIINDILDFSKIEAGKLEMEQVPFNLEDVLQTVVDLSSARASEKGLEYLLQVPPDTPVGLVGDQIRLTQVLSNLSSNAVKFTHTGQISLRVSTEAESPDRVTLRFEVQDTGIGLSPGQVQNLFQAFTQAESSTARLFGGTGLGLIISKRLVEMMGGSIWVDSEPGLGSTFTFTASFGVHAVARRYIVKRKDFRGLTAMVVDDNLVALEIMKEFLKNLGFTVMTADSGFAAVDLIQDFSRRDRKFDLLIIDWKMPDMDGIQTADRIHEIIPAKELPVIIMATAYNRDDVLDLARRSGIRNVMTKPLSPSTMLNMLMDIFGRELPSRESKLKKSPEMALVNDYLGARILLAEDNEVNQLVASRILKNAGLEVDLANNGLEAVRLVQEKRYDLVLMDIQMPEMDGIEATRKIRELGKFNELPIVAMTANAMQGDRELSLKAGMDDHINKPFNVQELFSTLARCLRKKQPEA
jgi:signal transduction histidine kinase/CheY-like chemotaxis protein